MKGLAAVLSALVALALFAPPSDAFNGSRRGFLLGFGIGPGYTRLSSDFSGSYLQYDSLGTPQTIPVDEHFSDNTGTVATDFRLGFGFTDRLLVFYDNKVSWSSSGDGLNTDGIASAAFSYYLEDAHPSLYLTGGVGSVGLASINFDGGTAQRSGGGFFGGVGYEMSERFGLEGTVTSGRLSSESGSYKMTTDCVSLRLHLIVQWY